MKLLQHTGVISILGKGSNAFLIGQKFPYYPHTFINFLDMCHMTAFHELMPYCTRNMVYERFNDEILSLVIHTIVDESRLSNVGKVRDYIPVF